MKYGRLSNDDYLLIQELMSDPLKSYNSISESLGKAPMTIKKQYRALEKQFDRKFIVRPDIDYHSLQLEVVDAYIALSNYKFFPIMEKALHLFEYIRYTAHSVGIGNNSGIYSTYTIPNNAIPLLEEFLNHFRDIDIIDRYSLRLESDFHILKNQCRNIWDPSTGWWNIDKDPFTENLKKINLESKEFYVKEKQPFNFSKIDKTQLLVLEELTFNSRRSNRKIYQFRSELKNPSSQRRCSYTLDVSYSTFLRAMKKIDPKRTIKLGYEKRSQGNGNIGSGVINSYRFFLFNEIFSPFEFIIIKGKFISEDIRNQFANLLEDFNPFQFQITFTEYKNGEFMLYISLPYIYLKHLTESITKYLSDDYQLYWLNVNTMTDFVFWPENYDFEKNTWKIDRNWVLENPLNEFQKIKKNFNYLF